MCPRASRLYLLLSLWFRAASLDDDEGEVRLVFGLQKKARARRNFLSPV